MNIKSFFKKQRDGVIDLIFHMTAEQKTTITVGVFWLVLFAMFVSTSGIFIGFIKTVLTSTVVCILSYNICLFFKDK